MIIRILLAAILGGLVVFAWEAVAHMALPLAEAGVKPLPGEAAMLETFKKDIAEPGFYFFPSRDGSPGLSKEQQEEAVRQAMAKMETGPAGILVIHPHGMPMMMPRQLALQLFFDLGVMFLAALLVWWAAIKRYVARVAFVTLLGLFPTLAVWLPLWNWFGFPTIYVAAQFVVHLGGFLAGGILVAAIARRTVQA